MVVEEAYGKSLEEIREKWAAKWGCPAEKLRLEVIDRPRFFNKQWKVRVHMEEDVSPLLNSEDMCLHISWQDDRYVLEPGMEVKQIIPFSLGGTVLLNGEAKDDPFAVIPTDRIEFLPHSEQGQLTWELQIRHQGLSAVALVTHKKAGSFALPSSVEGITVFNIKDHLRWKEAHTEGEFWDEEKLRQDLAEQKIVYGVKPEIWKSFLEVDGACEVVVAEALMPVPPIEPQVEDYVGEIEKEELDGTDRIDFFSSKLKTVKEGAVLARKVSGREGTPGVDVFGKEIPTAPFRDKHFKLKKNVNLSEDGLSVIAIRSGLPRRMDEWVYGVDDIYILNKDVDLETGSIDFSGDVHINGNVHDGLHVFAGGKVEISGSISRAEIRAEKGLKVLKNAVASKIIVGENFVLRSDLLKHLTGLNEEMETCLTQAELLANSEQAQHLKPGQCLKLLLERKFSDLPKKAQDLEKFVLAHQGEIVNEELVIAARTIKHFLSGLGPLELQAVPFLRRAGKVTFHFAESISLEVPEKLMCNIDYVQGAVIECGGDFECRKGSYNSMIRANGDITIEGVCRGGTVTGGGNITIRELGGSGVSNTTVQVQGTKRLKVSYCHPNVIIHFGKQIIHIEEAYKELEVYRENGMVQVEKLRAHN